MRMRVSRNACTHAYISACVCVRACVRACVLLCVYVCACVCAYVEEHWFTGSRQARRQTLDWGVRGDGFQTCLGGGEEIAYRTMAIFAWGTAYRTMASRI